MGWDALSKPLHVLGKFTDCIYFVKGLTASGYPLVLLGSTVLQIIA